MFNTDCKLQRLCLSLKKAIKLKNKKYVTFLYIPENESKTKTLRLAAWIPKFFVISLALIITYSVLYTVTYNNLKTKHVASLYKIESLTAVNQFQEKEIEKLEDDAKRVQTQLCENIAMLQELKEAVGINEESKTLVVTAGASNKVSGNSIPSIIKTCDTNYTDHIFEIKTSYVSLSKEAASQKSDINNSIGPIKDKLSYLKAKPSIKPVVGKITAVYGYRKNPFTNRGSEFHKGVDIGAKIGTPVAVAADGVVTYAGWKSGYGNMVIVSHGYGFITVYAHNSSITAKVGDKVKRGQIISKVGSTGRSTAPHLHYEVKLNGKNVDPSRYF